MKNKNYLITYNYYPEFVGVGKYVYELINGLIKLKKKFQIITTEPHYPNKNLYKNKFELDNTKRMQIFFDNSFISRLINYFRFINFIKINLNLNDTKLIVLVVPSIAPLIYLVSQKKKYNFKLVVYFQDIETNFFSRFKFLNNIINKFLLSYCDKCDEVITISQGMKNFLEEYTISKVHKVYNWFSYKNITLKNKSYLSKILKIKNNDKIVMVSLNYGKKINYELIIKILLNFKSDNNVKFVFVGDGKMKKIFEKRINNLKLHNAILLNHLDIINYLSLIRYSECNLLVNLPKLDDTVYPSRLTSILGVGGKVIFIDGVNSDFYTHTKSDPNIGICVSSNLKLIKKSIQYYINDKSLINNAALNFAKKYLDQDKSIKKLHTIFFN